MYDSDELRALAVAAQTGSPIAQYRLNDALEPETVLDLLDEIERLRKDAERYRWIRLDRTDDQTRQVLDIIIDSCEEHMDAAIDAARTQGGDA